MRRKRRARDFDLLGQSDFLLPGQQGDFAHLGQVHADRIVRPGLVVVGRKQELVILFRFGFQVDGFVIVLMFQVVDVVLNLVDRYFLKCLLVIRSARDIILKFFKQCVVQDSTPTLGSQADHQRSTRNGVPQQIGRTCCKVGGVSRNSCYLCRVNRRDL